MPTTVKTEQSSDPTRVSDGQPETPNWRQFEKLVARIETALSPIGAEVRSPDRIRDLATGELREVDASIRYVVGTTPILIIIECRDRKRHEGSQWIEQLATKRDHLGAAKCVAVSNSEFTKPAIMKAEALGVELRVISDLDDNAIAALAPLRTWFYEYRLTYVSPSYARRGIIELDEDLDRKVNRALAKKECDLHSKVLQSRSSGPRVSLSMYIENLINQAYENVSDEVKRLMASGDEITLSMAFPPTHYVQLGRAEYDLIAVAFRVIFSFFRDFTLQRSGEFSYKDTTEELVRGTEFNGVERFTGEEMKVSVHTEVPMDKTTISIWNREGRLLSRSKEVLSKRSQD